MKRFGPGSRHMRSMSEKDAFSMHLHLLIVMVRACLKGYPAGEFRQSAVKDTASHIYRTISDHGLPFSDIGISSYLLEERIKLLCIMASAMITETCPLGIHRREAVNENIETIIKHVFPHKAPELFHEVLRVA